MTLWFTMLDLIGLITGGIILFAVAVYMVFLYLKGHRKV